MKAVHEIVENSHTRNPMDIAMQIGIQIQYECMPMIFESFQIFAGSVLLLILNSDAPIASVATIAAMSFFTLNLS
jgi:hypothetical protein